MSAGEPTRAEVPPDTRPAALLVAGLRRGALIVFLPVFAVAQALAWLTYAATGWYHPSSWLEIGIAESLSSVRVAFDATLTVRAGVFEQGGTGTTTTSQLVVATGALTVGVLVLAFRAGRDQGRGLERRPLAAGLAGSSIGLGFGVPAFLVAPLVGLGLQRFGIERLEPVLWQALALPIAVAAVAGATGGLARARERLEEGWCEHVVAALRGGATAFWWGVVLSFVGVLLAAALSPGSIGAYARFVDRAGAAGAATVVQHALLVPNQSVLVLATSMGATTTLRLGSTDAVDVTRDGVRGNGPAGEFLAGLVGSAGPQVADFPWWFEGFLLVPLVATLLGGRAARGDARALTERVVRGGAAGVVFAVLCAIAVWAATITIPTEADRSGSITLGAAPLLAGAFALAWGVLGGALGASIPWPARLSAGSATPR